MYHRLFSTIAFLFLFNSPFYSQIKEVKTALQNGNYNGVIKQCETLLRGSLSLEDQIEIQKYINESYLNLNYYPEYLMGIKKARKLDTQKLRRDIYYYSELGNYYHQEKKMDSAIFFSNKSLELLKGKVKSLDSSLVYSVYSKFANCHRNRGVKGFNKITSLSMPYEERNLILNKYLDTALSYARNQYERTDVYYKKASVYLDYVAQYPNIKKTSGKNSLDSIKWAFQQSNKYYKWIIENSSDRIRVANAYALMGLNHHYLNRFSEADRLYQKSLENIISGDSISHLYSYINTMKWKGWNLDIWYNNDKDLSLLDKSIEHYRDNVKYWKIYFNRNGDNLIGEHDGYRTGAISKLAVSLAKKYLITADTTYLTESFQYADQSKYPKFNQIDYSIKKVQSKLKADEVFIQNITATNPQQELIYVIDKNEINVILNEDDPYSLAYFQQMELYQFNDLPLFKRKSYNTYKSKFASVDSILGEKEINKVIISNSDYNALLNYDLLIRDTLATTWENQPYLFHNYNFSYALSVRSFLEENNKPNPLPNRLGLSIGDFTDDVDLRFSKKLIGYLEGSYKTQKTDFLTSLEENNVAILVAHGNSQYENKIGEIRTSSSEKITVEELFGKHLSNDFVIITTCNSNASQINYSEGASGNFSKAFRYAGAKSTLTTSWEIDDKSNAFIMERFIDYLSEGKAKNEALWEAKKDFWNQASKEEQKPLYWAPYILTGSIEPITILPKRGFNFRWWWLLGLVPIGIYFYRRR